MRNFFVNNMISRVILCLTSVTLLMFFCVVRIIGISMDSRTVDATSNGYTLEINEGRGDFFDCNGKNITGMNYFYYVVFLPCDEAIIYYVQVTSGEERSNGLEKLRNKKPVIIKSEKELTGIGVFSYKTNIRYSNELGTEHFVGYLDDSGSGVFGLEKSFDDILKNSKSTELFFETTASGEFLLGSEPQINKATSQGSLYLTIDSEIQKICFNAVEGLNKCGVVVTDVENGKIRAMVSKPGFNVNNINNAINDENSPFLNRCLNAYSVGSVFKPLIAAALLENNKSDFNHNCVGCSNISGIDFYCNKHSGHGLMDLNNALIQSCNTYFYNASSLVDEQVFTELSAAVGFGQKFELVKGLPVSKGSFTSLQELQSSKAALANFSIGQGDITLSPLVISNLYAAIAAEGVYYTPTLIEGYTKDGKYYKSNIGDKNVVFSKATAEVLKNYLVNAVMLGTGKPAKSQNFGAGGKTATAQTGQYCNNKEVLNAWFCGFFPQTNPKYVIVVFIEDANSGGDDAAPIFKKISENIWEYLNEK